MRRRRPGRWLAPLALVIAAIAVYAIVQGASSNGGSGGSGGSGSSSGSGATTSTHSSGAHRKGRARPKRAKPSGPATYSVQQGDTLVAIAAKTGVPLDRLQALNPGLDASAMHIGQQIRLRP